MGKIITWFLFVVCCPFALYVLWLPLAHYANPETVRGSDFAIGWFWMNIFGFFPAVLLAAFAWLQRRSVSRRVMAIWVTPAIAVISTSAILYAWHW